MTAYWDDVKGEVVFCDSIDISIAVATEKVYTYIQHQLFMIDRQADH